MAAVWLGAIVLAALGVAFVVVGVRWRRGEHAPGDARAVFKDRAHEIAAEGKAARLPPAHIAALEEELALELLASETGPAAAAAPRLSKRQPLALLTGAIAAAALALGLYAWWGDPNAPVIAAAFENAADADVAQLAALESLLAARAQGDADANTHLHLASVRMRRADYAGAAAAFAAAHALVGPNQEVDLAWARARFLADEGALSAATRAIVARVLATAPNHPAMLELLAMGALRDGDYAAGARHLAALLRQDLAAPRRRLLEETLALARERQGADRAFIEVAVTVTDVAAPWLIVFARPVEGGGPPLAVARQRARAAQTVVLDDANAMLAERALSGSGKVRVVARLSATGTAADFEAEAVSEPVDPAVRPRVALTLRGGGAGSEGIVPDADQPVERIEDPVP